MPPAKGLYEDLITHALEAALEGVDPRLVERGAMGGDLRPELLAAYVHDACLRALHAMPAGESQAANQVALANEVLAALGDTVDLPDEAVADAVNFLSEIGARPTGVAEFSPTVRPIGSLRRSGLLVNGRRDVQVASEIQKEIPSADRIDLLCAFVRFSGLRLFQRELEEASRRGAEVRVITTVYTGSTERRALDALVGMGARVKVSFDTARTRLHAKAWLFHRETGRHTAYIGSSNLTHSAQVDGLEWNVRVTAADNPDIVERFSATFDQYWSEPDFRDYSATEDEAARLDRALAPATGADPDLPLALLIDVDPKPHQDEALSALRVERERGHMRNLVVAATGTGKTWIAAFDYKQLRRAGTCESLLFVAHRESILSQSRAVFRLVLKDPSFGEMLVAGQRPERGQHLFASIQSLQSRLGELDVGAYDMVIVDEFHHAEAATYRRLEALTPTVLLGLTATPERADGQSIMHWFDNRVAYESRLWDALDQGLLCPFHYFGVSDSVDLRAVTFQRGRLHQAELEDVLTGDHMRARRVADAVAEYVTDPHSMKALGFCAGVAHAQAMARAFNRFGLPAVALDATTPVAQRSYETGRLRSGELRAIFTVDLFNEGVDIPEVDTVLMLRPTESATVFLQQLGRGLRLHDNKSVLTVLDFIHAMPAQYQYDIRYRALIGGTRLQTQKAVEAGFPSLPPGCVIRLDRAAQATVVNSLRSFSLGSRAALAHELASLGPEARLPLFVHEAGVTLEDVYARPGSRHSFTDLRQRAGFTGEVETPPELLRAIGRMMHVDDPERFRVWADLLSSDLAPDPERMSPRERRVADMLVASLFHARVAFSDLVSHLSVLWQSEPFRFELIDLFELLEDRARHETVSLGNDEVPLASHGTYSLREIVAAFGLRDSNGKLPQLREGVYWDEATQTDLLFVTFEKSDSDYSPATRYADYPIAPGVLHWESQNSTTPDGVVGTRYRTHAKHGTRVLIFARERKKDARGETLPYCCLGYAQYLRHDGAKPMRITWQLERPMPASLYQAGKVVAG